MPPPPARRDRFRLVRTRRGVRLLQGGLVLSEIVDQPGPTHSLFDVLAAVVAAVAPGPRVAVLGFAGGGIVAPLRAMGFGHPLCAVDLSLEGERIFRHHAGPWAGRVEVARDDAVRWLRRRRRAWDLILDDLSVHAPGGVTKPAASLETLPDLVARRLAPGGIAATNLLPVPGLSWRRLLARLARPFPQACVVHLEDYENRFLLAGRRLEEAAPLSRRLRRFLRVLGSDQAGRVAVRTLRRG